MLPAFLAAVLLVPGLAQDAPRVSARLSATSAGMGEPVIFEIVVEGATGDIQISHPNFPPGLAITGTQDFTEMQFSLPGGRKQTRRREFALYANAAGRFRIPPVTVRVGNNSFRTNAVELQVSGTAAPRPIESSDNVWLRARMEPETVYVGQQSTLTVEAGFSDEIRLRLARAPAFETPSPTGFWVQDVPGGVQARIANINGRMMEVQSLQRAYFPLTAGRFALAPARAVIDIREGFLFAPETREIRSRSPRLHVLPLPDRGRPSDFKGAVGAYSVRASVQPDTVAVGEAAQITFEVAGTGNIKAAPQPVLPAMPGVEQFAPTEEATVNFDGPIVQGTKRFQWVVIPERAGSITVPAISYVFFDPSSRRYERAASQPITLSVRPSLAAEGDAESGATALGAVRTAPQPASLRWVRTRGFLFAQLVPVIGLAALALAQRVRRRRTQASKRVQELRRVAAESSAYPDFLRSVEAIVRAAVVERTGDAAARTAEVQAVGGTLRKAGVDDDAAARVVALIARLETQRFAPAAAESAERRALVTEAEELVRRLQREKTQDSFGAAVFVLMLLAAQPGESLPSLQSLSSQFNRGVALYRSGHFNEAASAFEAATVADSTDIAAWTNLGNAAYRAGERGRAIWAWARAARDAPRDAATIRNLQSAGAVEVLRTRPPLSVRPVEWYLLAALAWWLAAAIAAAALLRRRWSLLPWVLPALGIVVVALMVGVLADGRKYAVAIGSETRLYGDPTVHSPIVRTIQPGAGLDVIEERGDWLRVRTISRAEGWVESDAVGRL